MGIMEKLAGRPFAGWGAPKVTAYVALSLTASFANIALSASDTLSEHSVRLRNTLPRISVTSAPKTISAGATAGFTIRTSKINPAADVVVSYSMSGTAVAGRDYVAPTSGAIVLPAGTSSTTVSISTLASSPPAKRVATLRLQAGSGYKVSTPSRSSVTIMPSATPSPTPTSTATPVPTPTPSPTPATPQQEIWIAVRADGLPGSGTQDDPFDGSTAAKLDALLSSFQSTPNLAVHLSGAGPFRTDVRHSWRIRPGWVLSGDGMYSTTLQIGGNVAGMLGTTVVTSDSNFATDNVTIRDLTIDCNWPELSLTANTISNGEKLFTATAVAIFGSNNLLQRVRCINNYGSGANRKECFTIVLGGPPDGDGTNDIIVDCRAELPHGTYGNAFALGGWVRGTTSYLLRDSKVLSSTVIGINDGSINGFNSGGTNLANVKDCEIDGNTFIDCEGAAHLDTGAVDGLRVSNNTVIRGWYGVFVPNEDPLKQNIVVDGNNFQIQNRVPNGGSYGIAIGQGFTTNLTINNNTISFDQTGAGMTQFYGIAVTELINATVTNNTIGTTTFQLFNYAIGTGVTFSNNRTPGGSLIPGLGN